MPEEKNTIKPSKKQGFIFSWETMDSDQENSPKINYDTLYRMYKLHSDIYACVDKWIGGVVGNGWGIQYKDKEDSDDKYIQQIVAFLNSLDQQGNKNFTDMIKEMIMHLAVSGDNYWHFLANDSNEFIGIQNLHPSTISIYVTKYGEVLGYKQKNDNLETVKFEPYEILHTKLHSPISEVFGMSPLEPLIWEVKADLMAMKSNFNFFENDATPPTLAILDDDLSEEEQKRAIKALQQQQRGLKNRHKIGVLGGVKELKVIGYSLNDMQFEKLRRLNTEKICSSYKVPKALIGYTDGVNYSTAQTQQSMFYEQTARPMQMMIEEIINTRLLPLIDGGENLKFYFNESSFKDEQAYTKNLLEVAKLGDMVTINELRQAIDLPPLDEGGNELIPRGAGGGVGEVIDEQIQEAINSQNQKKKRFDEIGLTYP